MTHGLRSVAGFRLLIFLSCISTQLPASADDAWPAPPREAPESGSEEQARLFNRVPEIEIRTQAGIAAYRSTACACFDRCLWNASAGIAARWSRFVGLESDYRFGGIWIMQRGYLNVHGFGVGLRGALDPKSERLWDGLYARVGYQQLRVQGTRDGVFHGGYGAIGLQHGLPLLPDRVRMEHEVPISFVVGGLSHVTIGVRNGLVVRF